MPLSIRSSGCTLPHTGTEQYNQVQPFCTCNASHNLSCIYMTAVYGKFGLPVVILGVQWGSYSPSSLLVHPQLVVHVCVLVLSYWRMTNLSVVSRTSWQRGVFFLVSGVRRILDIFSLQHSAIGSHTKGP